MKAKTGFYVREICGQYMIVAEGKENIDFSDIISLNETAAFLWKQIEHNDHSEEELAKMLVEQYSLDENTPLTYQQAIEDVKKLHSQWHKLGIISD